jgi:hypothetical protein
VGFSNLKVGDIVYTNYAEKNKVSVCHDVDNQTIKRKVVVKDIIYDHDAYASGVGVLVCTIERDKYDFLYHWLDSDWIHPIDSPHKKENRIDLPNGCSLYWKENGVGGRVYHSDEVGGGVFVWDTSSVDWSTLLAAISQEQRLKTEERHGTGVKGHV